MYQGTQPAFLPRIVAMPPFLVTMHPQPAGKIAGDWTAPTSAAQLEAQADSQGAAIVQQCKQKQRHSFKIQTKNSHPTIKQVLRAPAVLYTSQEHKSIWVGKQTCALYHSYFRKTIECEENVRRLRLHVINVRGDG
jgi:hypothetical protein